MGVFEKKKINREIIKSLEYIIVLHSFLFFSILFFALIFFQNDLLSSIWASFRNDSWKFLENTIQIENPPYPYHLVTSSFHFSFLYNILSLIFIPSFSLSIAVLAIQYLGSLLTVIILFLIVKEIFSLKEKEILLYIWLIDSVIFSLFFLLATAEILFILYQTLSFYLLIRKRYFFASISAGLSFALRFNGIFFVMGFFLILFMSIIKEEKKNLQKSLEIFIYSLILIIISLIPFIYSQLVVNDFFLPLTGEFTAYSTWESYVIDNQIIVLPFTFWPTYIEWVFNKNELSEFLLLIAALVTFLLGFFSFVIYNKFKNDIKGVNNFIFNHIVILAIINFVGVNIVVSGRNFARFMSFTFPIFPIIIYLISRLNLSNKNIFLTGLFSFLLGLTLNMIWWINTDYCDICQHFF
ncbi:MAG: hypothetical protein ACW981_14220 [Candidatus Hodarchaeales archaeon]|jgi:hypothetical protein